MVYRIGLGVARVVSQTAENLEAVPSKSNVRRHCTVRSGSRLEGQVVIDRPPGDAGCERKKLSLGHPPNEPSGLVGPASELLRRSAASRCHRDDCWCRMPSPANADVVSAFGRPAPRR